MIHECLGGQRCQNLLKKFKLNSIVRSNHAVCVSFIRFFLVYLVVNMKRSESCFEISATPPRKERAPVNVSPVLTLEKFKGSPSLQFKDVKVGTTVCKGFLVDNPNACTVTVVLAKTPPAERGISFSESEFVLEAGCSRRIEVKWTPNAEGSWRDTVQVQVWGLPPPHLSFRVIMHLTSVMPKVKRKCLMAPFRSRNAASSRVQPTASKSSGRCPSRPSPKTANGKGKENTARKGNCLHPCDVPSKPIRRNTYVIENEGVMSEDGNQHQPFGATFVVERKGESAQSSVVEYIGRKFLKAMEESLSPVNFSDSVFQVEPPSPPPGPESK